MSDRRLQLDVRVVGAGLLGTSIGLALTEKGVDVALDDLSPTAVRLAVDYGAGRPARDDDRPGLVIVAVPPDVTARTVAHELAAHPDALVTDVASVKVEPLAELRALGADLDRYLGSHPMAGRERGGPVAARADLLLGRPWVLAMHDGAARAVVEAVENLALDLGAMPVTMTADEHDRAVAMVSHVPQLMSSLLAAQLTRASGAALGIAGQGLRDMTRIAASDVNLWLQILCANTQPIAEVLVALREDLSAAIDALENPGKSGSRRTVADLMSAGAVGVARVPGKHGTDKRYAQLVVMIDDTPGQLARLLTEIGELGVNMEDLRLEHSPGAQVGFAEVSVVPEAEAPLIAALTERGWRIAGAS